MIANAMPPADYERPEVDANTDGNVFQLIGVARVAMKRAGHSPELKDAMSKQVMAAKSYDEALQVLMRWVEFT